MYDYNLSSETLSQIKNLKRGQRFKNFHVFCDYLFIKYVPNNTNWKRAMVRRLERWIFWKTEEKEIIIKFISPSEMVSVHSNRGKYAKDYVPPVLVEEYYIKK